MSSRSRPCILSRPSHTSSSAWCAHTQHSHTYDTHIHTHKIHRTSYHSRHTPHTHTQHAKRTHPHDTPRYTHRHRPYAPQWIHGGVAGSGHYWSYLRSPANLAWTKFNDSNVTAVRGCVVCRVSALCVCLCVCVCVCCVYASVSVSARVVYVSCVCVCVCLWVFVSLCVSISVAKHSYSPNSYL